MAEVPQHPWTASDEKWQFRLVPASFVNVERNSNWTLSNGDESIFIESASIASASAPAWLSNYLLSDDENKKNENGVRRGC